MNSLKKILKRARQRGYLTSAWAQARSAWRWECKSKGRVYLEADLSRGQLQGELRGGWVMTQRLFWLFQHGLHPEENFYHQGGLFCIEGIPRRRVRQRATEVLETIGKAKPSPWGEAFDCPPQWAEGWATCLSAEGFEAELKEGQSYWVSEIPNWAGHVLVMRPGGTPLVGAQLDRFALQYPSEDEFVAQTETEIRQRVDELWAQRGIPYQFFVKLQPERRLGEPGHYFGIRRICATLSIAGMYGFPQESAWLKELKTCIGIVEARGDTLCLCATPALSQK